MKGKVKTNMYEFMAMIEKRNADEQEQLRIKNASINCSHPATIKNEPEINQSKFNYQPPGAKIQPSHAEIKKDKPIPNPMPAFYYPIDNTNKDTNAAESKINAENNLNANNIAWGKANVDFNSAGSASPVEIEEDSDDECMKLLETMSIENANQNIVNPSNNQYNMPKSEIDYGFPQFDDNDKEEQIAKSKFNYNDSNPMNDFKDNDDQVEEIEPGMIEIDEENETEKYAKYRQRFPWDEALQNANINVFGNSSFRKYQREIINASKLKHDVIALIPTGGGKSLTFQLPASIEDGISLIIMPLISLIADQLKSLEQINVSAIQIKGNLGKEESAEIYQRLQECKDVKLVYLTPEKILNSSTLIKILEELYQANKINRLVVDEAHCISSWGNAFRKDYLNLGRLKELMPNLPILALTGTANTIVKQDIMKHLHIPNCECFFTTFNRPNLRYEIRKKGKNIEDEIATYIKEHHPRDSGIIYCNTKKHCMELCKKLINLKISCNYYHASIADNKKTKVQQDWMNDKIRVVIATVALGMGINKKNVRFIIHYSLPTSLENYIQESGRAGRDGQESDCILYYCLKDKIIFDYITQKSKDSVRSKIFNVIDFCEEKYICRRVMMLHYLNEPFDSKDCNKMCDNCKNDFPKVSSNYLPQAAELIKYIQSCSDEMTMRQIINSILGKEPKKPKYGKKYKKEPEIKKDKPKKILIPLATLGEDRLLRIFIKLLADGVLKEEIKTTGKGIYTVIKIVRGKDKFKADYTLNLLEGVGMPIKRKHKEIVDAEEEKKH